MADTITTFDSEAYMAINTAREVWLRRVLRELPSGGAIKTALDVGCGAGYFSAVLGELGLDVTGLDLREANVRVCRERYPNMRFIQADLDRDMADIGVFDLVLMFGILYHLQSPLQTIMRLKETVGRVAVVETRVAAGDAMACYLFQEFQGAEHNLAPVTAVPTFPALVSMFKLAGLGHIYKPAAQPEHPQWDTGRFVNGVRHSFVALREPVEVPGWEPVKARAFLRKWEPLA